MEILSRLRRGSLLTLLLVAAMVIWPVLSSARSCPLANFLSIAASDPCISNCCKSCCPKPVGKGTTTSQTQCAVTGNPAGVLAPAVARLGMAKAAQGLPPAAVLSRFLLVSGGSPAKPRARIQAADSSPPSELLQTVLRRCQPGNAPPLSLRAA